MRAEDPLAPGDGSGSDDKDTSNVHKNKSGSYDYVVVGSGPSCAGFVWGLLQRLQQRHTKGDGSRALTIAVVERGPIPPFKVESSSPWTSTGLLSSPPSRWFQASHDPRHAHTCLHQGSVRLSTAPTPSPSSNISGCPKANEACWSWNRILDVPTGQGLGGTSLINACLCQLPLETDLHEWPEPYRSQMMESCRKVQRRLESNGCLLRWTTNNKNELKDGDDPSRTIGRTVRRCDNHNHHNKSSSSTMPYRRCTYWEGLLGSSLSLEFHNRSATTTTRNDEDDGALNHAYRRHIRFVRGQVERLIFEDTTGDASSSSRTQSKRRRVIGVEISMPATDDRLYRTLSATREVIVCAGALETPAMLLVSGIGGTRQTPGETEQDRIDDDTSASCSHLPVGVGLRDHVVLSRAIWLNSKKSTAPLPATVNGVVSLRTVRVDKSIFQMGVLEGSEYPSILPVVVSGWFRLQPKWNRSNNDESSTWKSLLRNACCVLLTWGLVVVRFIVRGMLRVLLCPRYSPIAELLKRRVVTVSVFLMNPMSAGTVAIRRKQRGPYVFTATAQPPMRRSNVELDIRLGYLESFEDMEAMRLGWIVSQSLLSELGATGTEVFPGCLVWRWTWPWRHRKGTSSEHGLPDTARFRFFAKATCLPYFHWTGSCRMMMHPNDKLGVVGPDLKVRGCDGLRICDASVFPTHVSAPTALACAALGHVFGSYILTEIIDDEA